MLKKLLLILILLIALPILLYVSIRSSKNKQRASGHLPADNEAEVVYRGNKETPDRVKTEIPYKECSDCKKEIGGSEETRTEIIAYIKETFKESANWGLSVAWCESRFDPDAESPNGLYFGLFQFSHSTFNRNCRGSIWEWKDQVICAKKLFDKGEAPWRWPVCNRIANQ